jgi:hypothetical protein
MNAGAAGAATKFESQSVSEAFLAGFNAKARSARRKCEEKILPIFFVPLRELRAFAVIFSVAPALRQVHPRLSAVQLFPE